MNTINDSQELRQLRIQNAALFAVNASLKDQLLQVEQRVRELLIEKHKADKHGLHVYDRNNV